MKKIGIITFHNSYNCGSMLETYAMQEAIAKMGCRDLEIINFSSEGQKKLYSIFLEATSLKNIVKNILIAPFAPRINRNNRRYEEFKNKYFRLSRQYTDEDKIDQRAYNIVVAGSDQIWNTTIKDASDHYFIDWTHNCRKVAYAPSFGAKSIQKYSKTPKKHKKYITDFDALSIRERNGKKWIKELTGRNAELLIDPTLLLDARKYDSIIDDTNTPRSKYIFFYCPQFEPKICALVKRISHKYKMPVICWSSKSYSIKWVWRYGFKLPKYESPSVYLSLIKNANLVVTTSFHGTIFSTIYRKKFFVIKNGDMFGDDDRVKTLIEQLGIENRLISINFDDSFDYFAPADYSRYKRRLPELQRKAYNYIRREIIEPYEKAE